MKKLLIALAGALIAIPAAGSALASEPSPPQTATAAKFSTAASTIGDLIDNAEAKAVLMKYIPDLVGNAQIEMARSMTLKQIQGFAGDALSDAVLAKIDADLAAIK